MYKVFKVSCFLIIWTRIDYGLTVGTSTPRYQEDGLIKPLISKNLSISGLSQELREEKENVVDATVRNFLPVKGKKNNL